MRCDVCGLQWRMTLAKIHQALTASPKDSLVWVPGFAEMFHDAENGKRNPPDRRVALRTSGKLPAVLVTEKCRKHFAVRGSHFQIMLGRLGDPRRRCN